MIPSQRIYPWSSRAGDALHQRWHLPLQHISLSSVPKFEVAEQKISGVMLHLHTHYTLHIISSIYWILLNSTEFYWSNSYFNRSMWFSSIIIRSILPWADSIMGCQPITPPICCILLGFGKMHRSIQPSLIAFCQPARHRLYMYSLIAVDSSIHTTEVSWQRVKVSRQRVKVSEQNGRLET